MNIKQELKKAFEANVKQVITYQSIIAELKAKKVKPEDVNTFLYSLFSDWPMKIDKNKTAVAIGLTNTLKDKPDYMPAKYINAFSVWRSRSYDAGTYTEKTKESKEKDKARKLKAKVEKEKEGGGEGKGVAVAASLREVDVPKYIALIAELAKKRGNKQALILCNELMKSFNKMAVAKPVNKKGKRD